MPTTPALPTKNPLDVRFTTNAYEVFNIEGGGPVFSLAWAPDSSLLIMGGNASILAVSIKTMTNKAVLEGHATAVSNMSWLPEGNTLASLSLDGMIYLWDMASYTEIAAFSTGTGFCLDWSPDGKHLAVGTTDGFVQSWDAGSGEQTAIWNNQNGEAIASLDWSPDGRLIATGDSSGAIQIWDVDKGIITNTFDTYEDELSFVTELAWSPNGNMLATAHIDGVLRIWDTQSWNIVQNIAAHSDGIYRIAWSPDSYMIASGGFGSDKSVPIWNPITGEKVTGVGNWNEVWDLAWAPNGKFLAIGTAGIGGRFPQFSGANPDQHTWPTPDYSTGNSDTGITFLWARIK